MAEPRSEEKKGFWERAREIGKGITDMFTGQVLLDHVDQHTPEGKAFVQTTDRLADQWGVDNDLIRKAAEAMADPVVRGHEQKVDAAVTAVLAATNLRPGTDAYQRERENLVANLNGIKSITSLRNAKYGEMSPSMFDDDDKY